MKTCRITAGGACKWVGYYFVVMLFYTLMDVVLWRRLAPVFSNWLNLVFILLCTCGYFVLLYQRTDYSPKLRLNISVKGILLAAGCSLLFYVMLDNCLDPVLERMFPISEKGYEETLRTLAGSPVTSLLQVGIIAPVIEEILMRDFVLGGLRNQYGAAAALLLSSVLFALLHFNMVQTLSALICGIVLGALYIKTNSVICCIIAHAGYNLLSCISYMMTINKVI